MRHRPLGIALSLLFNPHIQTPPENLALGLAALEKGRALGARTQRERDYVETLLVWYKDYDRVPHGRRVQAYLQAMEALAQRYPADDEAQIGYALALSVAASPNVSRMPSRRKVRKPAISTLRR